MLFENFSFSLLAQTYLMNYYSAIITLASGYEEISAARHYSHFGWKEG